jgi:predicted nucleic acid-binding protein
MSAFVDTSAFYAVMDAADDMHPQAKAEWQRLLSVELCTTNYVLVEIQALLRRRIGLDAVRLLTADITPVLRILWIDSSAHDSAAQLVLTAARRDLSFVDCVSFQAMRSHGIHDAFCFDPHFSEQGFQVLPGRQQQY